MEETKYPRIAFTPPLASGFVDQVKQFQREIAAGRSGQTISVAEFLNHWLTDHIKQTDQKYSAHMNANGIH
jgi:hemerythrin